MADGTGAKTGEGSGSGAGGLKGKAANTSTGRDELVLCAGSGSLDASAGPTGV
jgi:hypothetical protein